MSKIAVVLDEREVAELKVLLADGDGKEALRFLKEVIWAQVEASRRKGMQSHLEKGHSR